MEMSVHDAMPIAGPRAGPRAGKPANAVSARTLLPLYTAEQMQRHDVRPGITGWAQVKGRNALSWDEKFALDLWYVRNQSVWLDLRILFLTVQKVLSRDGVNADSATTMPRFTGSGAS